MPSKTSLGLGDSRKSVWDECFLPISPWVPSAKALNMELRRRWKMYVGGNCALAFPAHELIRLHAWLVHGMVKGTIQTAAWEAQVKWDRLYPVWSKRVLLRPGDVTSGTWLRSRWKFGGGVGCVACRMAGVGSPFGRFEVASPSALQSVNFQKHQDNPNHKLAATAYLSGQASVLTGCPDSTYFETLANDMVRGRAFDNSSLKLKAA
eukprot:5201464-Pyramimonas_sp.AAC.1